MKASTGSILGQHLRRKSTAALLMTNELRRSSRVSTNSFEKSHFCLGPDGLSFHGINLVPFHNGFRYTLSDPTTHKSSELFSIRNKNIDDIPKTKLHKITDRLLSFYEKSRIHYLLPILVLVIYSFLGGAIFYTIESPAEQNVLIKKKEYVEREEKHIISEVLAIDRKLKEMRNNYNLSTQNKSEILETFASITTLNKEIFKYRRLAMNRIHKVIYWYVLQSYYLNDQETYKSSLLNPSSPERLWKTHFQAGSGELGIGRILALRNYTQQLAERCWELGYSAHKPEYLNKALRVSIDEFNKFVGLQHTLTPSWTFWNSMFLAVTTYSTIGYGNIVPKTRLGKFFAMIYAVIGIPMTFMILHKLGRFFLLCLECFWHKLIWLMEFIRCVKDAEKLKGKVQGSGGMPVLLAIGVAFSWMFLCAAIFLQFEQDWDYFKSFYFFFCSLTTIGYGDVTPTNSEDMFIMFGFIIVGLSLVSMCINVIQLKLEALFEELLLTMMEEYGDTGQTVEEITAAIEPHMSLMDLWKVWKRRRQRRSTQIHSEDEQQKIILPSLQNKKQISIELQPTDYLLLPRQSKQFSNNLISESNFHRLVKLFPFGKMRREAILRRLQMRFNKHHKSTQTDFCCLQHGHGSFARYQPDINLFSYATQELDEEGTLTNNSSSEMSTVINEGVNFHEQQLDFNQSNEEGNQPKKVILANSPSINSSKSNNTLRVIVTNNCGGTNNTISSSLSSSPIALTSTSSSSSTAYIRRYLPSNSQRRQTSSLSSSFQTRGSVHSAPLNEQPGCSSYSGATVSANLSVGAMERHSVSGQQQKNYLEEIGHRRWTFFESGRTSRGEPRGLGVPYMYTKKKAKTNETTEMKRLIAEIDSRLLDCRTLVSPCSRSLSRNSMSSDDYLIKKQKEK
uniref:Potassium channel domain-containing protein n=2 Tax=Meloidogyne incognita group TaxID=654580 RepID=A0A914MS67_MELIC